MMIKKCKFCECQYDGKDDMNYYCSSKCRSRDRFIIIVIDNKNQRIWKKNYEKYNEFYDSFTKDTNRFTNKCYVCGTIYEKFSMCCSNECSIKMKQDTTFITTGDTHNLSNKSISRKKMEESLYKNYGIDNIFQREDVKNKLKDTWILKYGYDNPSKVDYIKNKKRKTAEINGYIIPKYLSNQRRIYEENVQSITWSQMKLYGKLKFGENVWDLIKNSRKLEQKEWLTVDHRFSKNSGFLEKIPPHIIGHICNLDLLKFKDNRDKWSSCSISIEKLYDEINNFEKILNF